MVFCYKLSNKEYNVEKTTQNSLSSYCVNKQFKRGWKIFFGSYGCLMIAHRCTTTEFNFYCFEEKKEEKRTVNK